MAKHEVSFNERLKSAAKARQTTLTAARANAPVNAPGYAERQAKPMVASIAREKRREEAIAGKLAETTRVAEEQVAVARAEQRAVESEKAEQKAELNREAIDAIARKAMQKAGRDAKYAARQARRNK